MNGCVLFRSIWSVVHIIITKWWNSKQISKEIYKINISKWLKKMKRKKVFQALRTSNVSKVGFFFWQRNLKFQESRNSITQKSKSKIMQVNQVFCCSFTAFWNHIFASTEVLFALKIFNCVFDPLWHKSGEIVGPFYRWP